MLGQTDLWLLSPEIAMTGLALLVVVLDFFVKRKAIISIVSIAGLAVPAACATWIAVTDNRTITGFYGMLRVDNYALFFDFLFILIGAGTVLASYDYVRLYMKNAGEFYALMLFALVGAMLMASTGELITIYIALELTSFPLYVMAGMLRNSVPGDPGSASRSSEAGIKYVLLGAMSSAILLYGMALLYGTTGSTDLGEIARALTSIGKGPDSLVLLLAEVFIFAGFGFKISAVPFHMWAPDIYQGAPTPGTLFFSVASKTAGFAALIRVFVDGGLFSASSFYLWGLIGVAAVLSMTLGNVVAIAQTDIKRMMAYSSIAQAGYILVGFTALAFNPSSASASTNSAMLVFLAVYVISNIGAFAGIIALANATGGERVRDFDGLVRRSPALALGMSLCLLSLAGIPPFAGAISKIFIFITAWQGGGFLPFIVIIALLNSVISLVYYAGVVYRIFVAPPPREDRLRVSPALTAAMTLSVIGILAATVFFQPLLLAGKMGALDLFGFLTLASK
ncbi:MAG: NADH-quinone oxidoreductase subunit N [Ktedonobacterales bacterium]|nr:NADH-quinone oxidoreductase subunit N [Ktedonobacterales bacterium]